MVDENVQRGLEAIERNAIIQTHLIGDLLDVARIMSGKMRFDPETFDPKTAALAAIENAQSAALTREVALDVRFDQAGGEFVWDSARFQQVVWNLVDNAVKFTPRGGRVEIVLTRR